MDKSNVEAVKPEELNTDAAKASDGVAAEKKAPAKKTVKKSSSVGTKSRSQAKTKSQAKDGQKKKTTSKATGAAKKAPAKKKPAENPPTETSVQLEMPILETESAETPTEKNDVKDVALIDVENAEQSDYTPDEPKAPAEEPTTESESDEQPERESKGEELPPEISEDTIDALSLDDEKHEKREDDEVSLRFDDFLAGYKKQISEMLKAKQSSDDTDGAEEPPEVEASDDDEDLTIPFPSLAYREDVEGDDDEEAVQLTIDLSAVPFSPLKESEKKEPPKEKKYSYDPKKPGFINNLFDIFEIFVFTVTVVLIVSSFFFRHSMVDGGSMDATLYDGEHLIISDLFYTPSRGDIVVFEDYSLSKKIPIVKRVIGIEGDVVRVENENGVSIVYVNGERLNESYTLTDDFDTHPTGEWTVGEGQVFVMGDHRNVSWDSRSFGTIDAESILGRVILRFYPFDRFGKV